jgi:uncharacterized RDD family membrane protein YckC
MSSGTQALQFRMSTTKSDVHVTGRRILATFIDAIILGAAYNFLVAMFGEFDNPQPWEWHGALDNAAVNIAYAVGVLAYYILLEGYLGQTLGKMVAGIAIVREDGAGAPGIGAALIRTVLRIVDGLLGYTVAFIAVLTSEKRQRLGDMAAQTLVVRR